MHIADIRNYTDAELRIRKLMKRESNNYDIAAYIFLGLGAAAFMLHWMLGGVLLIVAIGLFIDSRRNTKGNSRLHFGTITDKKHYYHYSVGGDDGNIPLELHYYQLRVHISNSFELEPQQAKQLNLQERESVIRVNAAIFKDFRQNDPFAFILTPANDLIGYLRGDHLHLLMSTYEFMDKSTQDVSQAIVQTPRSKSISWEIIDEE